MSRDELISRAGVSGSQVTNMDRPVPCLSQAKEPFTIFARNHTAEFEAVEKVHEVFLLIYVKADACRDDLREQLGELTQFDKSGLRVILKVTFGEPCEAYQMSIVRGEKTKIGG